MPDCSVCGNPVESGVAKCPWCGSRLAGSRSGGARRGKLLSTTNIKADLPTVDEARQRLDREVATARASGVRVLKVIHGYGSSGTGGGIGRMVRSAGKKMIGRGVVRLVVTGEEFDGAARSGRELIGSFPALKDDSDFGKHNRGITLFVLR